MCFEPHSESLTEDRTSGLRLDARLGSLLSARRAYASTLAWAPCVFTRRAYASTLAYTNSRIGVPSCNTAIGLPE